MALAVFLLLSGCTAQDNLSLEGNESHPVQTTPVPVEEGVEVPQASKWTRADMVEATNQVFQMTVSPRTAYEIIMEKGGDPDFFLLDLRTRGEQKDGRVPGTRISMDFYSQDFEDRIGGLDRNKTYMIYCEIGQRSALTLELMKELGFQRVYEIDGGFQAWVQEGLPVER